MEETQYYKDFLDTYQKKPFLFFKEILELDFQKGLKSLRGEYFNLPNGQRIQLFDKDGCIAYFGDYSVYKKDRFEEYKKGELTWQQCLAVAAYQDALNTFGTDFKEIEIFKKRWITIRSGRGSGKSAISSLISLHFLYCFPGSQTVFITNSLDQIKTVYIKELSIWFKKLPELFKEATEFNTEDIKIKGEKDWYITTRVSNPKNPVALSGFHGIYCLVLFDEASGIPDETFNTMRGTLTGDNFVSFLTGNPTQAFGEFYESHKEKNKKIYTQIHFNCRFSPLVTEASVKFAEERHGAGSDQVRISVDGNFPGEGDMNEKGWIPLFSGINIIYEKETGQNMIKPFLGLDPAGSGKNLSVMAVRDNVYLKEEFMEETSSAKSLARKSETCIQKYGIPYKNLEIDGFGVGVDVINEIIGSAEERPSVFIGGTDKLSKADAKLFNGLKMKRAWEFREWLVKGGVIITNNKENWEKELSKILYKRNGNKMSLMDKPEFKKLFNFSPDRFDASLYTFGRSEADYNNSVFEKDRITSEEEYMKKNRFAVSEPQKPQKRFSGRLRG